MPRITILKKVSELGLVTKHKFSIEQEPYKRLLKLVSYSLAIFRKPALYKVVIYLKNEEQSLSAMIDELKRLYSGSSNSKLLYHWAREYKIDSTHYGTHYHFIFIGDARSWSGTEIYVEARLKLSLTKLQANGWINNYSFSKPWSATMLPHSLKPCCKDYDRVRDLANWLSYNCKQETKEKVAGKRYGCSLIPKDTLVLNLSPATTMSLLSA